MNRVAVAGESSQHRAFDVAADGTRSNNRIFAAMASAADGVPDGMKVDVAGRVYCTGPEGFARPLRNQIPLNLDLQKGTCDKRQ